MCIVGGGGKYIFLKKGETLLSVNQKRWLTNRFERISNYEIYFQEMKRTW